MKIYLSQFEFNNDHRLQGSCIITVDGVTYTDRIRFSVDITGYCTVDCVSNGSMRNPKIWWGDFDPDGVFEDTWAAQRAVNRALKTAIPRLTPAGKQAAYWEQGASDVECARLRAMLGGARVEVKL